MNSPGRRYGIRREDGGLWTVYDVFTGQPAVSENRATTFLDRDDAVDLCDLLNTIDVKRQPKN